MSIKQAILGFLSWKSFSGYELKKIFADAYSFHWSGNNNQIYGSLVELHASGSVSAEVHQQEKYPAKKLYTITDQGREELRAWLLQEPELPVQRSLAHIQLAWAESLSGTELDELLAAYERRLSEQAALCREELRREALAPRPGAPGRSARERLIWRSIGENRAAFWENELAWAKSLRAKLEEIA
jgi:PadR family transcriptional regulator, regulatory protein AphA